MASDCKNHFPVIEATTKEAERACDGGTPDDEHRIWFYCRHQFTHRRRDRDTHDDTTDCSRRHSGLDAFVQRDGRSAPGPDPPPDEPAAVRSLPDSVLVVAFMGNSCSEALGEARETRSAGLESDGLVDMQFRSGRHSKHNVMPRTASNEKLLRTKLDLDAAAKPEIVVAYSGRSDYESGTASLVGVVASFLFDGQSAAETSAKIIVTGAIWGPNRTREFTRPINGA